MRVLHRCQEERSPTGVVDAGVGRVHLLDRQGTPGDAAWMGTQHPADRDELRLFLTGEHACGYWPDLKARDLVLDPHEPDLSAWYPLALQSGFRRSGDLVYRPHCDACRLCVPVRVPIGRFKPDRSQRRTLARNAQVTMRVQPAERSDEMLALYRRYIAHRHMGGGMEHHGAMEFEQFLIGRWSPTRFLELRDPAPHGPGPLIAVAVTDVLDEGLSAVYTFYDPDLAHRGLGTLALLRQIEWARREGRAHLYLGYWIRSHPKMDYKQRFRPLEAFNGQAWHDLPAVDAT